MKNPLRGAKITLIIYITLLLIFGTADIIYGLYIRLTLFFFSMLLGYFPQCYVEAIGLIVCGAVAEILVVLGYVATLKEHYKLQLTFAITSCFYLVVIMGIGISVTASDGSLNKNRLMDHFPISRENKMIWDEIHNNMHCCGITGPADWNTTIPGSCCYADPNEKKPADKECAAIPHAMFLYTSGCMEPLDAKYYKIINTFHIIMIVKATLVLIGISVSFYVISKTPRPRRVTASDT